MAQISVNLPAPSADGPGAAVDVSAMGTIKTMVVSGGAVCAVVVEISNDIVPQNWVPLWLFGASEEKSLECACRWMRVTIQQYKSGTPVVDVGSDNAGTLFAQLISPPADGIGASVDVSALGLFKTVHVGGTFSGSVNIEISQDGVGWGGTLLSFQAPGQLGVLIAARFMRVTRNGTTTAGTPLVFVGLTDQGTGGLAIAAGSQSANSGTIAFSNSNGISFGMTGSSVITASNDAFRSMIAFGGTATGPTLSFINTNGITFGIVGATLTASVQTVGGTATGVAISAGTQVATTGAVVFSNSNGIVFGLSGQTLTASFLQAAVQRVVGFTATGGETAATVTFTPSVGSTNYSVFGQLNGVSEIFGFDIPAGAAFRSVSGFAIVPTNAMIAGDQIAFWLYQST